MRHKLLILITALAFIVPGSALAMDEDGIFTAQELLTHCLEAEKVLEKQKDVSVNQEQSVACVFYVTGLKDGVKLCRDKLCEKEKDKQEICLPSTIYYGDAVRTFIEYMKAHPSAMQKPASTTFYDALKDEYPCGKDNNKSNATLKTLR